MHEENSLQPHDQAPGQVEAWLTVKEFAPLARINPSKARAALARCYQGKSWNGYHLEVRRSGKAYEVNVLSLPHDMAQRYFANKTKSPMVILGAEELATVSTTAEKETLPACTQDNTKPPTVEAWRKAVWKEDLILPALAWPPRSAARGEVIKGISAESKISERTLRHWIREYEKGEIELGEGKGRNALIRKPRHGDKDRVIISRKFDALCPLPDAKKQEFREKLETKVRSLWAKTGWSRKKIAELAGPYLLELCHKAGWLGATLDMCRIGSHFVDHFKKHKLVYIKNNNSGLYHSNYLPRITRDHSLLKPMEIVIGDVHPSDVLVMRDNETEATCRIIAWYDMATHYLFLTPILLEQGHGITQADVWASFAEMVKAWGMPGRLYLDNGAEYNGKRRKIGFEPEILDEVLRGFDELAVIRRNATAFRAEVLDMKALKLSEGSSVIRALPYNAAAKAIEGIFQALERIQSAMQGYIGGDRQNPRTTKPGKKPDPYPSFEAYEKDLLERLAWYHTLTQEGNLKGKSPHDAMRSYMEKGLFHPVGIRRIVLIYAMSKGKKYKVDNKGIKIGGVYYDAKELVPYREQSVFVRHAPWAPQYVFVLPNAPSREGIFIAGLKEMLHPADPKGAKQAAKIKALHARYVKSLEDQTEPVDVQEEIARAVNAAGPAPEIKFDAFIDFGEDFERLEKTAALPPPPLVIPQEKEEILNPDTGKPYDFTTALLNSKSMERKPTALDIARQKLNQG